MLPYHAPIVFYFYVLLLHEAKNDVACNVMFCLCFSLTSIFFSLACISTGHTQKLKHWPCFRFHLCRSAFGSNLHSLYSLLSTFSTTNNSSSKSKRPSLPANVRTLFIPKYVILKYIFHSPRKQTNLRK